MKKYESGKKVEVAVTQVPISRLLKSNEHPTLKRTRFLSTQYLKVALLITIYRDKIGEG